MRIARLHAGPKLTTSVHYPRVVRAPDGKLRRIQKPIELEDPMEEALIPVKIPDRKRAARKEELKALFSVLYKRHRYLPHKDRDISQILAYLSSNRLRFGDQKVLSDITGVPTSTLSTWKRKLQDNKDWVPSRDNYGQHLKIFTDEQEAELMRQIRSNYLDQGLFYSDQDFRYDAIKFYNAIMKQRSELPAEQQRPWPERWKHFRCSPAFIIGFRRRWQQSLRRPNFKRRPAATREQIENFRARVNAALLRYGSNRVFNMDETNYRLVNNRHLTWAYRGQKTVNCAISNDIREGVTVLATVTAAGEKLPLMILGKGTTQRCLKGFDLTATDPIWGAYSKSGWTTEAVMLQYLKHLRDFLGHGERICLILDTYAAHRTASVKQKAEELNIELLFIPPGCTDACQPLDVKVFGVLKAYAKMLWRKHYHTFGEERIDRAAIAEQLLQAWEMLTPHLVASAWEQYEVVDFSLDEDVVEEICDLDDEEFQMVFGLDSPDDL